MYYVINADGEGYQYDPASGPVPEGAQLFQMSEEQGLIPVDTRLATDQNIQYGEPGSLGYQLATLGGMGYNEGFDSAGFSNPDSVAAFLEPYVPAGTDLSGAIQDAWQQQQNQFGYWSGADDPGQTALKILAQVDDPWAQQATQAIASSPEFAQSQYAGTAALNYDPDAGTFYGVPGPIASAALGMALGPMGLDFGAMLGGGVLGGAGTGALSSAIMGGDPLMGALTGSVAPGLNEMGLPSQYIPLASSLAGAAINGGDLTQGLIGGISGTLSQLSQSPTYNYTAEDANYLSEEQPSFTATVVPDEPTFPQEQGDFPIYQPESFYMPDGPIIQAAMGNYTPDPAYQFEQQPMVDPTGQNNGLILPGNTINLADSSTQIPAMTDMTGFYTPPSAMEQAVMGQQQETPTDGGSMTDMTGFYRPDFMDYAPTTEQTMQNLFGGAYMPTSMDFSGAQPNTGYDWTGTNTVNLGNSGQTMPTTPIPGMSDALWNQVGGAYTGSGTGSNVPAGLGGLITNALKNFFGSSGGGSGLAQSTNGNNMNMLLPLLGGLLGYASGGSKPAGNTTTTQDVPDWQKPYITGMLDSAKNVYNAAETNNGFLNNARTQLNSTISGDYLNSNPANQSFQQMSGYTNPYEGLLAPTATGAFLNSNPYLDATYDRAARNMTDQYKYATMPSLSKQFGHMQAFGGNSGYQQSMGLAERGLATGLGDLATGIYGNNYANERGMMQNAQTGLLGSANATQGIRAAGASGLAGNFNTARGQQLAASTTAPGFSSEYTANAFAPINNYSNLVGRSFGSQTQQPYYSNPTGGALSGALAGYSLSNLFGK